MKFNNIINKIKEINPNIKFVGTFDKNNRRTGYWEEYWFNGELNRRGNYINGKEDGYWETYHANGKLSRRGNYLNGKRDGYWESYWPSGNIWQKGNYINGKFYEIK